MYNFDVIVHYFYSCNWQ